MLSLALGSLQLMLEGTDTGYIVELPIQGLDSPDYRESMYDKPGADGSVLSSLFYGARTVTLMGHMTATSTAATYEARRRALGTACAIQRDANDQPVPIVLSFTTRAGSSYFCNVYARKPVFDYTYATTGDFLLNLVVPDGAIYGSTQVTVGPITRPTGGGFHLPTHLPITATATTGGSITVTNDGNASSFPTITLTGPLTNPYVSNSATGQFMQLNYTIPGGSNVIIDMANNTIMLNGSSPLLSTKATGSTWWTLPPGPVAITLSTASASDTGNAQVQFYPVFTAA